MSPVAQWLEDNFRECPRPKTMTKESHEREDAEWEDMAAEIKKLMDANICVHIEGE